MVLFFRDYADMEKGVLAPYTPNEIPAKFTEMIGIYDTWRPFFDRKKADRDRPATAGSEIEAFRAKETR